MGQTTGLVGVPAQSLQPEKGHVGDPVNPLCQVQCGHDRLQRPPSHRENLATFTMAAPPVKCGARKVCCFVSKQH